ncbi:class I SAM-dependent methyltransferase [Alteraurantiacibacter palmitatis]|uniref:Class I SAM-dependent methyltransferase n=1 Tax=Alteraurantiacibacter palmitatis TaxID=2054628 RepID=A0ABV7E888_9SPHN
MRRFLGLALALGVLTGCGSADDAAPARADAFSPSRYAAAINDIARPAADREADAQRKPGELLAFAQIRSGEAVGDYIMGGGYMTRLLAQATGGSGRVYAFQPDEFIAFRPEYASEQDAAVAPYADNEGNPVRVFPLRGPVAAPDFPEPLDAIISVMNLHDLYLASLPEGTADTALAALYAALKPGGRLIVVDHRAPPGSGAAAADSLHRMDEALARTALETAGFVLEAESDLYTRPDDPRTANVFDAAIRGRTDQFAWRLRKPENAQ